MNAATGQPVVSGQQVTEGNSITVTVPSAGAIPMQLSLNGEVVAKTSGNTPITYTYTAGRKNIVLSTDTYITEKKQTIQAKDASSGAYLQYTSDISVIYYEGVYYMYTSAYMSGLPWTDKNGVARADDDIRNYDWIVWTSTDLQNWTKSKVVATLDDLKDIYGFDCYTEAFNWAPDVYHIGDKFYLVSTYWCTEEGHNNSNDKTRTGDALQGHRAIVIMVSDSPEGPFEPTTELCTSPRDTAPTYKSGTPGHITPAGQDCIDAIIWFDGNNQPWLVWSDESTNYNWDSSKSTMQAAKLDSTLTHLISKPITLFCGYQKIEGKQVNGTTDAPWIHTTSDGEILMVWSTYIKNGGDSNYCIVLSRYSGKTPDDGGTWTHESILYDATDGSAAKSITTKSQYYNDGEEYQASGGHANIVETPDGQLYLAFHLHMNEKATVDGKENLTILKCPAFVALSETKNSAGKTTLTWGIATDKDFDSDITYSGSYNVTYNRDKSVTVSRVKTNNTSVGIFRSSTVTASSAWWAEVKVKPSEVYAWHTQGFAIRFDSGKWLVLGAGIRNASDRTILRVAYLPNGAWGGQKDTLPTGASAVCSSWNSKEYLTIRLVYDGTNYTVYFNGVSFGTYTPSELGAADFGTPTEVGIGCRMDATADSRTTYYDFKFAMGSPT